MATTHTISALLESLHLLGLTPHTLRLSLGHCSYCRLTTDTLNRSLEVSGTVAAVAGLAIDTLEDLVLVCVIAAF